MRNSVRSFVVAGMMLVASGIGAVAQAQKPVPDNAQLLPAHRPMQSEEKDRLNCQPYEVTGAIDSNFNPISDIGKTNGMYLVCYQVRNATGDEINPVLKRIMWVSTVAGNGFRNGGPDNMGLGRDSSFIFAAN